MRPRHRRTDPIDVDLWRVEDHLRDGRRHLAEGDPGMALLAITRAIFKLRRAERKLDGDKAVL